MADPFAVFAAGTAGKQNTLKTFWPELYNVLARTEQKGEGRIVYCPLGSCPFTEPRPIAVARIYRFGPPACKAHVAKLADRPGGWPLAAEENKPDDLRRQA